MPDFYPRPPCGGRLGAQAHKTVGGKFLSTSPLRGTTYLCKMSIDKDSIISIHVPLAGDDPRMPCRRRSRRYFYPRPPCGGRPGLANIYETVNRFLSTSPLRGTTRDAFWGGDTHAFLSTSPLRGTTHLPHCPQRPPRYFYPRPPCGGRLDPLG